MSGLRLLVSVQMPRLALTAGPKSSAAIRHGDAGLASAVEFRGTSRPVYSSNSSPGQSPSIFSEDRDRDNPEDIGECQ